MALPSLTVLQAGLPDFVPGLIGIAGTLVLVMLLVALGGIVYKTVTGGIEWPEDRDEDEEDVRRGGSDDEWDYY